METQVVIIGAGIMGAALARELSRYNVDVTLVEKQADVSMGVTKASNGTIYSPQSFSWVSSATLKGIATKKEGREAKKAAELEKEKLCIDGANSWVTLLDELDLDYFRFPHFMIVATSDDDLKVLEIMEKGADARSCYYRRLNKQDLFSLEPNLTKEAIAGLCDDKSDYIVLYPWEAVMGLTEIAMQNGVKLMLNTEVTGFSKSNGFQIVETNSGPIKADFIVNAAGADGAQVAALADARNFSLQYFKGCSIIGDKNVGGMVNGWITSAPRPGKMGLLSPLPSGNLMIGLIYIDTHDPHAVVVDRADLEEVFARGQSLLPALTKKDVVAYFATSRVFSDRDPEEYIIEYAPKNPRFINSILRLPGIGPAPAIAKKVTGMLADHGLSLTTKTEFNPYRKRIPRFNKLSDKAREELVAQDIRYSHVICRCETVTEGEIVEAINRGASTLDGVRFRTRAGMGRCQGGFCGPRVVDILARELNIDPTQVTKNGGNSRILLYKSKELLKTRKEYAHGS